MSEKFAFGNILTWTFTVFYLVLFSEPVQSQTPKNAPLYLWNGFSHHWGYNHRVNRLGDYLEISGNPDNPGFAVVHTAASGSGADVADFTSYYTRVEAPRIFRTNGVERIHLQGRKGELIKYGQWVTTGLEGLQGVQIENGQRENIDLAAPVKQSCAVVLNGFDLFPSEGFKPDKFIEFQLSIDSIAYFDPVLNGSENQPGKVSFYIRVAFNFACSTPECPPFKRISSYELDVHWLAFVGDFFSEAHRSEHLATWTKDSLPDNGPLIGHLPEDFADPFQLTDSFQQTGYSQRSSPSQPKRKPDSNDYYPALGITGFGLQLEGKDLHFADLNFNVRMGSDGGDQGADYDASPETKANEARQESRAILHSYFGQWTPGMYDAYRKHYAGWPKLPAKWVVKKAASQGILKLDYLWLGFKQAAIEQNSVSGQVEWLTRHGKQESSGGEKAMTKVLLR